MASAHTPGPWAAVNRGSAKEPMMSVMAARIAGQPPRHEVAICATGDSPQEMENANARLIAAAPDLLEALTALVRIDDHHKQMRAAIYAPGSDTDKAYRAARAAIAKAEGK